MSALRETKPEREREEGGGRGVPGKGHVPVLKLIRMAMLKIKFELFLASSARFESKYCCNLRC
jgi:hypothetical protein